MAAIPLTIAMRQEPMARRRPSIYENCQYKKRVGDDIELTQDTTAPILKFVARGWFFFSLTERMFVVM
jgi:hypothetical protein